MSAFVVHQLATRIDGCDHRVGVTIMIGALDLDEHAQEQFPSVAPLSGLVQSPTMVSSTLTKVAFGLLYQRHYGFQNCLVGSVVRPVAI